ncbi:MAG: SDR family oxidoreductase [Planctomycetota bacterium]
MTHAQAAAHDDLTGRIAVVTGAASGIGQATAEHLRQRGAVVAGLDLHAEGIPADCRPLIADVRDQAAVSAAIAGFAEAHGRLDVLVNNVAVSFVGTVEDGSEEDWLRVLDINVLGQMRVMRAALPWLRKSDAASVVVMSSCSALNGLPQRALYSASKGAVQAMAQAMAADLVTEGVCVNCVSPGTVDTPFMTELIERDPRPDDRRHAFASRQPTGRMVAPIEVARAVAYLAHPQARSSTGTTLVVDGGMGTIRPPRA